MEALSAFDKAAAIRPDSAAVWGNMGIVLCDLGRAAEALAAFRRATEIDQTFTDARDGAAAALARLGDRGDAEAALARRFRLPPGRTRQSDSEILPHVLVAVFQASADRETWEHRVGRLAAIAQDAQGERDRIAADPGSPAPFRPLTLLADALVRSLTHRAYAESLPGTLEAWADVWRRAADAHPDLSLAARLFGVGVRHVRSNDPRVLLDLLQEERAILRDLFRLDR